jgi:hypothetical protein
VVYMQPPPDHDGGQLAVGAARGPSGWTLYCHLIGIATTA